MEPPTDIDPSITTDDRLPKQIIATTGKINTPKVFKYYLQDEEVTDSLLPQTCKGGMLRMHLIATKQGKKDKFGEIRIDDHHDLFLPSKHKEDIYPKATSEYAKVLAFCASEAYYIRSTTFIPDVRPGAGHVARKL